MSEQPARSTPTRATFVQTIAAIMFAALTLVTIVTPQWIEEVFHIDPDAGSGVLEWLMVLAAGLGALSCAGFAIRGWRRRTPIAQD